MEKNYYSAAAGIKRELEEIEDICFSQEKLGPTFAVLSDNGEIYAPGNGTVEMVFDTKHAIGMKTEEGEELLIHIGINTVELKGRGFKVYVKEGQKVVHGQRIASFNQKLLRKKGYDDTVFTILCGGKKPEMVRKSAALRVGRDDIIMTEES